MNWPNRALMKTQQAPPAVQSARLVPEKLALITAQRRSGQAMAMIAAMQASEMSALMGVEK